MVEILQVGKNAPTFKHITHFLPTSKKIFLSYFVLDNHKYSNYFIPMEHTAYMWSTTSPRLRSINKSIVEKHRKLKNLNEEIHFYPLYPLSLKNFMVIKKAGKINQILSIKI